MRTESAPAHRRLDALDEHEVTWGPRGGRLEHLDRRPDDPPLALVTEPDAGAVGLEVVELLGVEPCETAGVECRGQEGDRAGGGVPSIVPAPERAHHRWGPQAIRTTVPNEGLHPNHRTS